jgi:hypothetical protein
LRCALLYYFTLSNAIILYLSGDRVLAEYCVNQTICPMCLVNPLRISKGFLKFKTLKKSFYIYQPLSCTMLYFIILLCLMPDVTCQVIVNRIRLGNLMQTYYTIPHYYVFVLVYARNGQFIVTCVLYFC